MANFFSDFPRYRRGFRRPRVAHPGPCDAGLRDRHAAGRREVRDRGAHGRRRERFHGWRLHD